MEHTKPKSLWLETAELPAFPPLEGACKTDVLIIGGGLAGLLCAYRLREAGTDCLLVEAGRICQGVTGHTTAKITAQHGLIYHKLLRRFGVETTRRFLEANQKAVEEYRRLARAIPCDFEEQDSFVYTTDHPGKVEQELNALERLDAPADYVGDLPLPFPTAGAVRFQGQAQFHPLKFASGLAKGLNIREETRVLAYDGRRFVTNRGVITADRAIVTTHFPLFNNHGGYFLKLYQHRSYVLALEGAPSFSGMYVDEASDGLSFRHHGDLLLLGGGSHRTGKQGGGWRELSALAKWYYPAAEERYRWAAQDCMSLDGMPYIGQYSPQTPNLYTAAGFNKWGVTSSMVAASLLTDLVLGRQAPYAPVFSPSRSIFRPQLFLNGLETTANFLTPTRPRCPHLGCALKWNRQEHSWDCPCHGSRFGEDGTLLDTPANGDLPT